MSIEARVGIQVWRVKCVDTDEIFLYKDFEDALLMAQFQIALGHIVEIL